MENEKVDNTTQPVIENSKPVGEKIDSQETVKTIDKNTDTNLQNEISEIKQAINLLKETIISQNEKENKETQHKNENVETQITKTIDINF